jgi:LPXTG-motif cell wall-anchored protein
MKKTIFLIAFLVLVPIALSQNITVTTGQLPTNYTLSLEINNLVPNDTIEIGSDDWITLEVNSFVLGENDTNYTFNPILSVPLIEQGNYTKKIFYNATGFSGFEIPIEIEIRNDTETYQNFLENEEKEYLDCVVRKLGESGENNSTKRLRAEYECRYEVTNNPNGTIVIQTNTIIEEKPVIDNETANKITNVETSTSGLGNKIDTISTDLATLKTDFLNRINQLEENISQTKNIETSSTGINWTVLIIIAGLTVLILGIAAFVIIKKRQNEGLQPAEISEPIPMVSIKPKKIQKEKKTEIKPKEEKKGFFKKKEPKSDFDRLI